MSTRNESLQIMHSGASFVPPRGAAFASRLMAGWQARRQQAHLRAELRRLMATDEHLVRDLGLGEEVVSRLLGEKNR